MVLCVLEVKQVSKENKVCLFHHPFRGSYGAKAIKKYTTWIMCSVLAKLNITTSKIITISVPPNDDVWVGSSYHVIAHRFRHSGTVKKVSKYNSDRMIKFLLENKFTYASVMDTKSIESTLTPHSCIKLKFVRPLEKEVNFLFVECDDLSRHIVMKSYSLIINFDNE